MTSQIYNHISWTKTKTLGKADKHTHDRNIQEGNQSAIISSVNLERT